MFKARVLGIPQIEGDEVVFAVWVQRSSTAAEIVQVVSPDPETIHVEAPALAEDLADAAHEEVARWVHFQRRFMDRLYARLRSERTRTPIPSHIRQRAAGEAPSHSRPSAAPRCSLCAGTGESEKFLDRSSGHARWAFGPKVGEEPYRERGSLVPCPSCRRLDYDQSFERPVSDDSLSSELERVEAIVTGRTASIRERIRSVAPSAMVAPRGRHVAGARKRS
jgi:hypothetical protein